MEDWVDIERCLAQLRADLAQVLGEPNSPIPPPAMFWTRIESGALQLCVQIVPFPIENVRDVHGLALNLLRAGGTVRGFSCIAPANVANEVFAGRERFTEAHNMVLIIHADHRLLGARTWVMEAPLFTPSGVWRELKSSVFSSIPSCHYAPPTPSRKQKQKDLS